jgi:hypothetical protein
MFFSLVAACEPRVLPSRGLEVDLSVAETTPVEVAAIADEVFLANGFSVLGKGGYEELTNQHLTMSYSHPRGTLGSVGLNNDEFVPIRINVRTERWNEEANDLFEQLALTLESHWPGSVQKEPIPMKK